MEKLNGKLDEIAGIVENHTPKTYVCPVCLDRGVRVVPAKSPFGGDILYSYPCHSCRRGTEVLRGRSKTGIEHKSYVEAPNRRLDQ